MSENKFKRAIMAPGYLNMDGTPYDPSGGDSYVQTVNSQSPDGNGNVDLTAADIGLGNVNNTSDADKPVSTATQTALDAKADQTALAAHTSDTTNPHSVTKAQVGLGDVDNTSDADKPVSTATQAAIDARLSEAQRTAIDALTPVDTADATDLDSAIALANANKAAINGIIAALQAS